MISVIMFILDCYTTHYNTKHSISHTCYTTLVTPHWHEALCTTHLLHHTLTATWSTLYHTLVTPHTDMKHSCSPYSQQHRARSIHTSTKARTRHWKQHGHMQRTARQATQSKTQLGWYIGNNVFNINQVIWYMLRLCSRHCTWHTYKVKDNTQQYAPVLYCTSVQGSSLSSSLLATNALLHLVLARSWCQEAQFLYMTCLH